MMERRILGRHAMPYCFFFLAQFERGCFGGPDRRFLCLLFLFFVFLGVAAFGFSVRSSAVRCFLGGWGPMAGFAFVWFVC